MPLRTLRWRIFGIFTMFWLHDQCFDCQTKQVTPVYSRQLSEASGGHCASRAPFIRDVHLSNSLSKFLFISLLILASFLSRLPLSFFISSSLLIFCPSLSQFLSPVLSSKKWSSSFHHHQVIISAEMRPSRCNRSRRNKTLSDLQSRRKAFALRPFRPIRLSLSTRSLSN